MTREETVRAQAALPVFLRIQADIDRVSARLRPLLLTVKQLLFEKSFKVGVLWRKHRIRDRNAASFFRELDTTPHRYILGARMEVAEALLLRTNLPIRRIAGLVGYGNDMTFRRAFKSWKGINPSEVRQRVARREEPGFDKVLADGVAGRLSPTQTLELASRLKVVMLELRAQEKSLPHDLGSSLHPPDRCESYQVELFVLPRLAGLSFADQRQEILRSRPFATSALFDALHQRSRDEGRQDRRRGVELAQLALESVEVNAGSLGPLYHVLRPQAWAWLGNAHRLNLDFLAADRAIDRALQALHSTDEAFASAIVHLCQGTLRTFQRRHEEAVQTFDIAFRFLEGTKAEAWQVRTLILRAAALGYAERFDESLTTLWRAESLPGADHEHFSFLLPHTIVTVLVRANRCTEAKERLRELDPTRGFGASRWRVRWLEAYLAHGDGELLESEAKYLAAVRELEDLEEPLDHAVVLLDLAVLYADLKRSVDLLSICKTIYRFFDSLRLHEETSVSIRLLGQAILEERVSRDLLRRLRSSLNRDPLAWL